MATIALEVEDAELGFLRELLAKFPFVKINEEEPEDSDEAIRANVREGIRGMSLVEGGKLKTRSAREFLNELGGSKSKPFQTSEKKPKGLCRGLHLWGVTCSI